MELFDEEDFNPKKSGNKKTTTIILVIISIILVLVIALAILLVYLKQSTLTVKLNGQTNQSIKNMLVIDEANNSKVYVPIKQIASYLGYEAFSGSYATKSEESNQCYVQSSNEVAMFALNSKTLYKTLVSSNSDYEYYYIDEAVVAMNSELYTTIDGIEKAFNVAFNYDVENKNIEIYTMDYLINSYAASVVNYGYTQISEDFTNQKAVLENMLVVEKGEDSNKKVGVLSVETGANVLEPKYDAITYLDHTSDFLVTDNNKQGIISSNRKTKVAIQYDKIQLMDYDAELYLVEQDKKQGVIDFKGNTIINLDYDAIGIDISKFKENEIRNGYILAGELIPVEQNDLWGFYDTKGNQVTECKYDNLGYVVANNKAGYSLLVVPDYNVIVVGKDEKYTVLTVTGKEVWDFFPFDNVYLSIGNGVKSYKMTYNTETLDLTEYLDRMGYGKEASSNQNNSNNQNNENQEEVDNTQNQENNGEVSQENNSGNNEGNDNNGNDNGQENNGENGNNDNGQDNNQ